MYKEAAAWGNEVPVTLSECDAVAGSESRVFYFDAENSRIRSAADIQKCLWGTGDTGGGLVYFAGCDDAGPDVGHWGYDSRAHAVRPRDDPNLCLRWQLADDELGGVGSVVLGPCAAEPVSAIEWTCTYVDSEMPADGAAERTLVEEWCSDVSVAQAEPVVDETELKKKPKMAGDNPHARAGYRECLRRDPAHALAKEGMARTSA